MRRMEMATSVEKCRQKAFHLLWWELVQSITVGQERAHRELGSEISVWPKEMTEDVWRLPIVMCEARSVALYIVFCWARIWGYSEEEIPLPETSTEESSACGFLAVFRQMKCHSAAAICVRKTCLYMLHESCTLYSNAEYVPSTILFFSSVLMWENLQMVVDNEVQ